MMTTLFMEAMSERVWFNWGVGAMDGKRRTKKEVVTTKTMAATIERQKKRRHSEGKMVIIR
jgi:hypothetical protein